MSRQAGCDEPGPAPWPRGAFTPERLTSRSVAPIIQPLAHRILETCDFWKYVMVTATSEERTADDRGWYIVSRWREYDGEARSNLLRLVGIASFYSVELANHWGFRLGILEVPRIEDVDRPFHLAITALAVAWTMTALAVQICLRRQVFPAALKFLSTGADIVLMTCVLCVSNGPRSPLVVGYFLVVVLAALRFSLPLVWFATVGSMLGYLAVLGHAKWFAARDLRVPRYHELMFLLALGLTGITIGQVLRAARSMAVDVRARRAAVAVKES